MRTRKLSLVVVSLVVVTSLLLAACGPTTQPTAAPGGVTQVPVTVVVTAEGGGGTTVVTATPPPAATSAATGSKDPTTLTIVQFGDAETFDPALDYESAGITILFQMYDQLITYNREQATEFVPSIAQEVPSVENGGISDDGLTYTFNIRPGVKFHDGTEMTPEDVAFSFHRGLLQGGTSSPQWLYYEALFGEGIHDVAELIDPEGTLDDDREALQAADATALADACQRVIDSVTIEGDSVVFHLVQPWGPMLATLANSWGAIQSKEWVGANGGWDGDCATWQNFYGVTSADINQTAIGSSENGTGPYMLDHWTPGEEIVLKANEDYWLAEPLWEGGPSGAPAIKTVIIKIVDEWSTRLAMAQAGDADFFSVNIGDYAQVDPLVGEECDAAGNCTVVDEGNPLRVFMGLPTASRTDAFLNFAINAEGNNFIGSGQLDGNGIPPDFFSDIHIRKGFAYCFDWDTYIADALNGEAVQSTNVMLPGMIGYDENFAHYSYDPDKCAEEFQLAELTGPNGEKVWDVGFRMTIAYNTGNTTRQTVAQIFQNNLNAVNELFVIEVTGLPWPTFLNNQRAQTLPIFISGWLEDIHDPHNWVVPYTVQTYGARQTLPEELKAQFQDVINRGVAVSDPAERHEIYQEFNQLFYDEVPTILLAVPQGRHYEQRWVQGYYYNPIAPTSYYALSKK
jgi:peptide/nickel transport system substrate-binding protein